MCVCLYIYVYPCVQGLNEVLIAFSLIGSDSFITCKADLLARMKELKYLLLDGCQMNGDFSEWSKEVRWLQWRHFPYEVLPQNLNLSNLVIFDLAESLVLTHVWPEDFKIEVRTVYHMNKKALDCFYYKQQV
jgi:hypothetical protein